MDEDADWGYPGLVDPTNPEFSSFHDAWNAGEWWSKLGYDPRFGQSLPALFERAGLIHVSCESSTAVVRGGSVWPNWFAESLDVIAAQSDAMSATEQDKHAVVVAAFRNPSTWVTREILHCCVGTKP